MTVTTPSSPARTARSLGYQPALDGLRAVAVTAVLLFHDGTLQLLPGGFLGVDVFFVLSGFLITTILLTASDRRGSPLSVEFWIRRVRRLIPAFLIMVLLISAITMLSGDIVRTGLLRTQGLTSIFYVYNWYAIRADPLVPTLFSHTWSLSIEEQWYLVWPFLLAGLLAATRRRTARLLVLVLVLAAASFVLMATLHRDEPVRAFFGTDARAWQLLAGAALATVWARWGLGVTSPRARRAVDLAALAGLAVLAWAFVGLSDDERSISPEIRLVVVAAVVAVIVAGVQRRPSLVGRALSLRPVVAIGLISYGLYLFHIPVYAIVNRDRVHLDGAALLLTRLAAVTAVAALSYRYVERPLRHGARLPRPAPAFFGLTAVAVATVTAVFLYATAHPAPVATGRLAVRDFRALAADTPSDQTRVLVAGDESATALVRGLRPPVTVAGIRGAVAATPGCGLLPGDPAGEPRAACRDWTDVYREAVEGYRPSVAVLMTGTHEIADRRIGDRRIAAGTPEATARLRAQLERARRILTVHDVPLVITTLPCSDPTAATTATDPARRAWFNTTIAAFAAAHPRTVRVADLGTILCPGGDPHPVRGGRPLTDASGLTGTGIGTVWLWLAATASHLTP